MIATPKKREKGNPGVLRLPPLACRSSPRSRALRTTPSCSPGRKAAASRAGKAERQLEAKLPEMAHWTIHDLRRTSRTLMSREAVGISEDLAERIFGHAQGGIRGVYARHRFEGEMGRALVRLADLI